MKICREKASSEVYIYLEEGENIQGYFVLPDGRVDLFDRTEFEAFVEQTDEMYLREYLIITAEQYRTYRKYKEALINDIQRDYYA
jgi:hypothetical protein